MKKDIKRITTGSKLLLLLLEAGYLFGRSQDLYSARKMLYSDYTKHKAEQNLRRLIYSLERKGWLAYEYKNAKKIIKLTSKGELKALLEKSKAASPLPWDGKWTLVSFDIPEAARTTRNKLRQLLKQYGFKALQESLYVSPNAISDAGIEYLTKSKLIDFIRIFRAEQNKSTKDIQSLFRM